MKDLTIEKEKLEQTLDIIQEVLDIEKIDCQIYKFKLIKANFY